jgi:hypothetical protein
MIPSHIAPTIQNYFQSDAVKINLTPSTDLTAAAYSSHETIFFSTSNLERCSNPFQIHLFIRRAALEKYIWENLKIFEDEFVSLREDLQNGGVADENSLSIAHAK